MWARVRNWAGFVLAASLPACFFMTEFDDLHGGSTTTAGGGGSAGPGGQSGGGGTVNNAGGGMQVGGMGGAGAAGGAGAQGGNGGSPQGGNGGQGGTPLQPDVVLNEVVADPVPGQEDWIELHNRDNTVANISGWSLSDGSNTYVFMAGAAVAANGYLTLDRNAAGSFTFGLAKTGETLVLRDGANAQVDSTTWTDGDGTQPNSWGRIPNGTGSFQTTTTTKNAANN